jgi:hypothetical protein
MIDASGNVVSGAWLSHKEVRDKNAWAFEQNLRDKKYFEV